MVFKIEVCQFYWIEQFPGELSNSFYFIQSNSSLMWVLFTSILLSIVKLVARLKGVGDKKKYGGLGTFRPECLFSYIQDCLTFYVSQEK